MTLPCKQHLLALGAREIVKTGARLCCHLASFQEDCISYWGYLKHLCYLSWGPCANAAGDERDIWVHLKNCLARHFKGLCIYLSCDISCQCYDELDELESEASKGIILH